MSACEWNPIASALAVEGDGSAHDEAVWSIGAGRDNLHLCESCADLPVFKRRTKRVWIGPRCRLCGCQVRYPNSICGECACEDDGDIW